MEELKSLQSENESLKNKAAKEALGDVMDKVVEIGGVKVLSVEIPDTDEDKLHIIREAEGERAELIADFKTKKFRVLSNGEEIFSN